MKSIPAKTITQVTYAGNVWYIFHRSWNNVCFFVTWDNFNREFVYSYFFTLTVSFLWGPWGRSSLLLGFPAPCLWPQSPTSDRPHQSLPQQHSQCTYVTKWLRLSQKTSVCLCFSSHWYIYRALQNQLCPFHWLHLFPWVVGHALPMVLLHCFRINSAANWGLDHFLLLLKSLHYKKDIVFWKTAGRCIGLYS